MWGGGLTSLLKSAGVPLNVFLNNCHFVDFRAFYLRRSDARQHLFAVLSAGVTAAQAVFADIRHSSTDPPGP